MSSVFALATPATKSALCVFRVSGFGCLDVFGSIFNKKLDEPRKFYQRSLVSDGVVIDKVGVVFFRGPSSYTGEDSFEIYAHGGLAVMASIVDLFKSVGFDEAGPGEFTKRAFINGKLSLSEAESVVDVINASSKDVLEVSLNSLRGGFSEEVFGFSKRLDDLRKFIEGSIDFSDEDYDFIEEGGVVDDVSRLCADFGGFVNRCFLSGEGELKKITFDDILLKESKEILEDLIVAAHNDAKSKLEVRFESFLLWIVLLEVGPESHTEKAKPRLIASSATC